MSDAGPTCDYSKAPVYALVANQGNGGPNPTDGVIQFDLKLVNTTANAVALNSFKVRYYFTDENAGPSTTVNFFSKIDGANYVAIDASKISIMRYDLAPAKTGPTRTSSSLSMPRSDRFRRTTTSGRDCSFTTTTTQPSTRATTSRTSPVTRPPMKPPGKPARPSPACPTFANCKTVVLQNSTVVFGTPP